MDGDAELCSLPAFSPLTQKEYPFPFLYRAPPPLSCQHLQSAYPIVFPLVYPKIVLDFPSKSVFKSFYLED